MIDLNTVITLIKKYQIENQENYAHAWECNCLKCDAERWRFHANKMPKTERDTGQSFSTRHFKKKYEDQVSENDHLTRNSRRLESENAGSKARIKYLEANCDHKDNVTAEIVKDFNKIQSNYEDLVESVFIAKNALKDNETRPKHRCKVVRNFFKEFHPEI